ncbi:MAG: RNA polymerase sigma factor [Candidatus Zixiibacteriota bacterium]
MGKDKDLFWQLIEKEHKSARAYCFHLTGGDADGDDLYQDSIIKAYHGFDRLKKVESFKYWLYRIVNNNFKSRFRMGWWKKVFNSDHLGELPWTTDPSGQYDARRKIDYALASLSTDDRMLVVLSEIEGWKITELAEIFAKTEGTIKMRLMRARDKMRKRLAALNQSQKSRSNAKESISYEMSPGSKDTQ